MFIIIALLLILVGLVGSIACDTLVWQIISAVACVAGIVYLAVYYKRIINEQQSKYKALKEQSKQQEKEYESQLNQMKANSEQLGQQVEKLQSEMPVISSEQTLEQKLKTLREYFSANEKSNKAYGRLFAELEQAVKNQNMLKSINSNFTTPLMERLNQTDLPIEEKEKQELTSRLLQLALIAIDYTQEYRSTHNGDDSLALRVATGAMTVEEAASKATKATSNVYETEKDLRILWNLVQELGQTEENLIVHDTLLVPKES